MLKPPMSALEPCGRFLLWPKNQKCKLNFGTNFLQLIPITPPWTNSMHFRIWTWWFVRRCAYILQLWAIFEFAIRMISCPSVHPSRTGMETCFKALGNLTFSLRPFIIIESSPPAHDRIKKGQILVIPIAAVNKDKSIWGEDAYEFRRVMSQIVLQLRPDILASNSTIKTRKVGITSGSRQLCSRSLE